MNRYVLLLFLLLVAAASLAANDMMSVQVADSELRARAGFTSSIVATLSYGERVEVLSSYRGWYQVITAGKQSGWVHSSALTPKRIELSSGGSVESGASSEEVVYAGKGFNDQVEREYKAANNLDYSLVDEMETWKVDVTDLLAFLEDGDLKEAIE